MDGDLDKRAQFEAGRKAGKSVKELIMELGVPKSTAYQWNTAAKDSENDNAPPDSVPPPSVASTAKPRAGKRTGGKITVRPISEDTAGTLLAGIFFVPAMLQSEPEWMLTPEQKAMLAGPFADSLRVVPAPIADAVNTYSAPGIFLTSLAAVVSQKANRIAHKRALRARGVVQFRPAGSHPGAGAAPPPQGQETAQAAADRDEAPPAQAPPAVDNDLASAMAAARGSLTEQDEAPSGAEAFA